MDIATGVMLCHVAASPFRMPEPRVLVIGVDGGTEGLRAGELGALQ